MSPGATPNTQLTPHLAAPDGDLHGAFQRFEQPVRLRDRDCAHVSIKALLAPAAHLRFPDVHYQHGSEGEQQVSAQQAAIQLDGLGPQARPLVDQGGALQRP